MNKEKKMIPELRFPEFVNEGKWVEKVLSEIANYENGKAHEKDIDENGNYIVVNSKFISTDGEVAKYSNEAYCLAEKGDILMVLSDIPNGRAIAKCFYINEENKYTVNQRICKITSFECDSLFLYYVMNRNAYFLAFDDGVKQTNLRNDDVQSFPFLMPLDAEEQQKIASCLSSLDEVIAAHSQKLAILKDHKKGLMQNLFPQEGETVPKLRFPEFVDDGDPIAIGWVQKKLGDCLSRSPEYGINAPAVPFKNELPTYLRITDISEDGRFILKGKVSVDKKVTENNYLSEGDIVLARTGASVGKSYKYRNEDGKLVFAGFLIRIKPDANKLDSEFLFQFLSTNQYWNWVSFISARSGQPGINGTEYSDLPILLPPKLNEQQKIASCLSSLDDLITAQTEKIEQLKQHKKGLMQGLFP